MAKPKEQRDILLAAIQRKVLAPHNEPAEVTQPAASPAIPGGERRHSGKAIQFWLHEEDRQLIRELAAWLAGQGLRATDSLVIRTALRTAQTGADLVEAYRRAAAMDGRLRPKSADGNQSGRGQGA